MDDNIDTIVQDAASNVACETKDVTPVEVLEQMKQQLMGLSGQSDESFIYELVKNTRDKKGIDNGKRK